MLRRFRKILFSTSPRFGATVWGLGMAFLALATILSLMDSPRPPIREIGTVMFWCGLAWVLLTWYLEPFPMRGLGIVFAVLFVLIVPDFERGYTVWIVACLSILVAAMANLYRDERKRADHYVRLLICTEN